FLANNADSKSALQAFKEWIELFKPLADGQGQWAQFKEGLDGLEEMARTGDFNRLNQLAEGWDGATNRQKAFGMLTLAFGAWQAAEAGKDGDYAGMVKELCGNGRGGLEMAAGAMAHLST